MSRVLAFSVVWAITLSAAASPAAAQFWGRPSVPQSGACFYRDSNFRGDYFCSRVGAVMAQVPYGANDQISSIQVFGDAEVVVFRDINFRGASRVFDSSITDLRRAGFNDRVSSFRVGRDFGGNGFGNSGGWGGAYGGGAYNGGGWGGSNSGNWAWGRPTVPRTGACFYESANFGGRYFCASVGTSADNVPDGSNDKISSIRLFGNAEVTVFRDNMFNGQSRVFDTSLGNLRSVGWNNRISSFRVTNAGRRGNWGGGGAYGGGSGWNGGNWGGNNDWGGGRRNDRRGRQMTHAQAAQIVQRAYRAVLGRDPDPASEGWLTEVMNGRMTEAQLRAELQRSPEGQQRRRQ